MKICYVDNNEEQIGLTEPYHMDRTIAVGSRIEHRTFEDEANRPKWFYVQSIEVQEHYLLIKITPECL